MRRYTKQNMRGWVNIEPWAECPECLCLMWQKDPTNPYDKKQPGVVYMKCPTCGYIDTWDSLQDNMITDFDIEADVPAHCLACCGPFPNCKDDCEEYEHVMYNNEYAPDCCRGCGGPYPECSSTCKMFYD